MLRIFFIISCIFAKSAITEKTWSSQLPDNPFHSNDWVPLPSSPFQQQIIQSNVGDRQSAGRSLSFPLDNSKQYTGPQVFPVSNVQHQPSLFADKSPDIITKAPGLDPGGSEGRSILVSSNFNFGSNDQQHVPRENVNVLPQPSYLGNSFYQQLNPLTFQSFEQQAQQQLPQHVHQQIQPAVVEERKPEGFNPFPFQPPIQQIHQQPVSQQQEEVQLLYVPLDTLWQHKFQQQQQQLNVRPQPQFQTATRSFIDPMQINNFYTPQPYTTSTTTTTAPPPPPAYNRFSVTPKPQYFSSNKLASQQFSQSPNSLYTTHSSQYDSSPNQRFTTTPKPMVSIDNYYSQPRLSTTTAKPVPKKSHQPPLSMFVRNGLTSSDISVGEVLATLKNLNSVDVLDSPGKKSPKVFIGPSNLFTPNGYSKFELPYLSSIESSPASPNGSLQSIPFFVAPQSYRAPKGFAKIPLPAPHIGSFVHSAGDNFGLEKASRRPATIRANVEVNIGSTRYAGIPTEQPYTQPYKVSSLSTPLSTENNGLLEINENTGQFNRPKAEKNIKFRTNQNANNYQSFGHVQNEEYYNVKKTRNYVGSTPASVIEATPSGTPSHTRNPHSPNYFHYDSYNNNSNVPALRLQNFSPVAQSERPVEFVPSPKSEHDDTDVFRPMTEQPSPSSSYRPPAHEQPQQQQVEYDMKNYFRGQTELRTPLNVPSFTLAYDRQSNHLATSTQSSGDSDAFQPVFTESNYISESTPSELPKKKIVYFPPAEQETISLNHNEVFRVRNVTRSSRPVSRFRYQYSTENTPVEQTTKKPNEETENRNYPANLYTSANFASILNPIMNYFTGDGSDNEKPEVTSILAPVKDNSAESIELPRELPPISARLPGMINNLLEDELVLSPEASNSTSENYTTAEAPTTTPAVLVMRRRPNGRRTVPIRTTTTISSSEKGAPRQTTPRSRRTYSQATTTTASSVTRTRNSPIRSRNVTSVNRGSSRARGTVKAKDNKEENWEYQRDELNQNYPAARVRKVSSYRGEPTTSDSVTEIPSTITTTTTTEKLEYLPIGNSLSLDFLNGVPMQLPEKYKSSSRIESDGPIYEVSQTTMKAQQLNNELTENAPKPHSRRVNFGSRAARPSTVVAQATVAPVEITERIDAAHWRDNYVGQNTNQPEYGTEPPKKVKLRNKRIRKPSSVRMSVPTTSTELPIAQQFTDEDIHRQINQFNAGFYSETPQPTRLSTYKYTSNQQHPYSKYFSASTEDSISTAAIFNSNKRRENSVTESITTETPITPLTNRRRGVWKRIRVRPVDVFETAESQYIEKTNYSVQHNTSDNLTEPKSHQFEDSQIYTNQVYDANEAEHHSHDLNYESQKVLDTHEIPDNKPESETKYIPVETTTALKEGTEQTTVKSDEATTFTEISNTDDITEPPTTIENKAEIVTSTTTEESLTTTIDSEQRFGIENSSGQMYKEIQRKEDRESEIQLNIESTPASHPVVESPATTLNYETNEPVLTTQQPMQHHYSNNDEYDEEMVTEENEMRSDDDEVEAVDEDDDEQNEQSNLIGPLLLDENSTKQYMTIQRQKPPSNSENDDSAYERKPSDAFAFHKNLMKSVIYATSTSTRVTHDTEICYRGRCIRTDKKS